MNHRILIAFLLMSGLFPACKPTQTSVGQEEAAPLAGTWEAEEIIVLKDFGTKEQHQVPIPPRLDRKPVVTIFDSKGTFTEQTWAANDSLLQSNRGFWHRDGDSLFLSYAEEGAKRNSYGMDLRPQELKLAMSVDFDLDGKCDDRIQVIMRRQ